MAVIKRDVVLMGKSSGGDTAINMPITRLGNIEDDAEIKAAPTTDDFIPIIDMADGGQMKKTPYVQAGGEVSSGNSIKKISFSAVIYGTGVVGTVDSTTLRINLFFTEQMELIGGHFTVDNNIQVTSAQSNNFASEGTRYTTSLCSGMSYLHYAPHVYITYAIFSDDNINFYMSGSLKNTTATGLTFYKNHQYKI